jgi:hypothetical protein
MFHKNDPFKIDSIFFEKKINYEYRNKRSSTHLLGRDKRGGACQKRGKDGSLHHRQV